MEHRTLGRSGLVVSTYALGTMTFGAETGVDDAHDGVLESVEEHETQAPGADLLVGEHDLHEVPQEDMDILLAAMREATASPQPA